MVSEPYYSDESVTLLHGDCLDVMTRMPDESVDAVVTDPPYSSGGAFRSDRVADAKTKYLTTGAASLDRLPSFYGDTRTERGLLLWSTLWLTECWRVTREGGAIAMFCDWRSLPVFSDALQAGGWVWRGIGVWIKPKHAARPVTGGLWNDTEMILWGSRGARADGECLPGTWTVKAPSSQARRHATEKPLPIVEDLVRLAPHGGRVLDPFAGSGTTGIAAARQGRAALLVESSRECVDVAADRLRTVAATGADLAAVGGDQVLDFGGGAA